MKSELFDALIEKSEELLLITDSNFLCKYSTKYFLDFFDIKKNRIQEQRIISFFTDNYSIEELQEIAENNKFMSTKLNFSRSEHQFSIRLDYSDFDGKIFYFFQFYKPNIIKDEQLNFLSESTIELINIEKIDDIYKYISEKSLLLTENCITASFKYDNLTDRIEMIHLSGLSNRVNMLFGILGRNPVGMQFPISEQGSKVLKTGNLMRGPDDLFTLSSKWLPEFISKRIKKLFDINKIYLLGITRDNRIIGELIIFVRNGGFIKHPSLLETFIQHAGIILDRKNTEIRLAETEIRYQTVFNESQIINLIIDAITLKFVEVNDAACKFYGYTREEFNELYIYDLNVNPVEKVNQDLDEAHESLNKYFIFRHRIKSGEIRDVEVNASILEISGKKYIFSQIKDITDVLNTKHRLERGEKITKIGNWEIDLNSKRVYASDGAKKIYGINKNHLDYEDIVSVPLREYRRKLDAATYDLINNNIPYDLEFKIKSDDTGMIKNVRSIAHYDKEKNILYGALQDVTDIVKINEELNKAKEAAEESDRLKSSFLANLSHEIRTPMNAIKGFAEILKEPDLSDEEMQEYINIININSDQLLSIINDVLDISKIESGAEEFIFENIKLNSFCSTFEKSYSLRCDKKGIKFNLVRAAEDCYILADKSRMIQVCDNLFSNAVKFTHSGEIEIGFKKENEKVVMFVKDTGIGIPSDKRERIFERFYQIEENYRGENTGTGLGLAITKSIVEKMNGKIEVFSEINKGSIFQITLDSYDIDNQQDNRIASENPQNNNYDTNLLKGKNILIAEDLDNNYELLKAILKKYSCNLERAKNGLEAFKKVKEKDYDIILMDIKMPEMDGITSASMIYSIKPYIPIIAQTAYAMSEDKEKIKQSKCLDMIVKPISQKDLLSVILKYL
jgi:PAS domain S-box-containing protein